MLEEVCVSLYPEQKTGDLEIRITNVIIKLMENVYK